MPPGEKGELVPFPAVPRDRNALSAALDAEPVRLGSVGRDAGRACPHEHSSVDEGSRRVACRDCGADLDPVGVLARLARDRERLLVSAVRMRRERDRLAGEVERLRLEERNARARLRRLGGEGV